MATATGWNVPITDSEKDNYGPFTRCTITNLSDEDLQIDLNATRNVGGNEAITVSARSRHTLYLPTDSIGGWTPEEDIVFYTIAIYNLSATTVSANEIIVEFGNQDPKPLK